MEKNAMATSKPQKTKSKISGSESASVTLNSLDISNTLSQLATGINNFRASHRPPNPPAEVLDDLHDLQNKLSSLAVTSASDAIAEALKDLKEPGKKIANFTSKIKTAIKNIKDRDQAFNTLATLVNGLTNAVNSGNPQDILKIFNS